MSIMMKNSFTTIFLQKMQGNKRKRGWCFTNFPFILTKHSRENNRKIIIFFFFISIYFSHSPNRTGACNNFYQKILYKFYFVLRVCVCARAGAGACGDHHLIFTSAAHWKKQVKCHLDIFNSKNKSLLTISRIFSFMIFFLLSV